MRYSLVLVLAIAAWGVPRSSLGELPPRATARMLEQLQAKDWILRADALHYLGKHSVREAARPIRDLLSDEKVKPWLRGRALVAFSRIEKQQAAAVVLPFATDDETTLRGACAEALRYIQTKEAAGKLEALLKDDSPHVRHRALASYAALNGAKAWPVVDAHTGKLGTAVDQWATQALALTGTEQAIARIEKLAAQSRHHIAVLRGIAEIRNPKLIPTLLGILSTTDHTKPQFAIGVSALQEFDEPELRKSLQQNLEKGTPAMIRTIAMISPTVTENPLLSDAIRKAAAKTTDRKTTAAVLSALGSPVAKPDRHRAYFIRHLSHKNAEIRTLAIRGLARCQFAEIYETLRQRMDDETPAVVLSAIAALQAAPTAIAPQRGLVEYLKTPLASDNRTVRKAAQDLLAHAGSSADFDAAMKIFGSQLASRDAGTREEAARVLGSLAPIGGKPAIVRAQGYVSRFKVVGTFFSDLRNGGFKDVHSPEKSIDFKAKYTAKYAWVLRGGDRKKADLERVIGWSNADVDATDGKLILPPLLPPPAVQSIAYAVADITLKQEQPAVLDVDGDDAFRVWLNGKPIARQVGEFKNTGENVVEQLGIKVMLKSGRNRFLIKTANLDNQWWIRLRLTDNNGVPVEMTP